jgi:orotate phosphoribosyltransferase
VISTNERFIVAEDVVTRGGRVHETVDIVRKMEVRLPVSA